MKMIHHIRAGSMHINDRSLIVGSRVPSQACTLLEYDIQDSCTLEGNGIFSNGMLREQLFKEGKPILAHIGGVARLP
jgi:hypothetical protein